MKLKYFITMDGELQGGWSSGKIKTRKKDTTWESLP
jgi:hypothetical protein